MGWDNHCAISELSGKTLTAIEQDNDAEIIFTVDNGEKYRMFHEDDCCENVYIEDVCGDLSDLIGNPLLQVEESSSSDNPKEYSESHTWTFYKFATIKGSVTIRWYGESNGYYSESVDFEKF